jgi:hypothetical protein
MTTALSGSPGSPNYTAPPSNATEPNQGQTATGDVGAGVVGETVKGIPWVPNPPTVTITQQYGTTSYTGEPPGHGQPHWHAGVDLGYTTGTVVEFPTLNQNAIVSWFESAFGGAINLIPGQTIPYGVYHRGVIGGVDGNSKYSPDPEGYGDHACTVTLQADDQGHAFDVILGHGQAWLQADGANITSGDQLLSTDTEGNASGPHLHFEVRPVRGAYGTDVDPWAVLTNGEAASFTNPATDIGSDVQAAGQAISSAIETAVTDAEQLVIGLGMSALGTVMMGGAGWIGFQAIKGAMPVRTATGVVRTTTRTLRRPASGGAKRSLMPKVRPASGAGPTSQASAPRTTPAPPRTVAPPPRTAPAPAPSAPANVGASAVAKVSRGANPSTLTAVEGAWLKAHPAQLVAALRAAGKAA